MVMYKHMPSQQHIQWKQDLFDQPASNLHGWVSRQFGEQKHSRPLASRAACACVYNYLSSIWWAHPDSNQGPTGYEPAALPLSYGPA